MLFVTLLIGKEKSSFRDSYVRYVSTHDFFRLLMQKFPDVKTNQTNVCEQMTDENRAVLGEPNPVSGELAYTGPSPSFLKYYGACLLQYIDYDFEGAAAKPNGLQRYFGKEACALLEKTGQNEIFQKPASFSWNTLSPEVQLSIARHLVHAMIGPEIVKNEAKFVSELVASLAPKAEKDVAQGIKKLLFFIGTQDEFLSY